MSLLLMDSADQPPYQGGGGQWSYVDKSGTNMNATQYGRHCYQLDADQVTTLTHLLASAATTFIVGVRLAHASWDNQNGINPTGDDQILRFWDGATCFGNLAYEANGTIVYYGQGGDVILAQTPNFEVPVAQWYYLELKVVIHDTTGSVELRINGQTVASASGVDTQVSGSGTVTEIDIGSGEGVNLYARDFYICDGAGSAFNDFLGPVHINSHRADGAGNYTNWTPSAGANYECIDDPAEADNDGDTTYVETVDAERDSYTFDDMPSGETPMAVQAKAVGKFVTAQQDINTFLRRSATDDDGATDTSAGTDYSDLSVTIWEEDPVAAGAWTETNFNSTEFGIRTTT